MPILTEDLHTTTSLHSGINIQCCCSGVFFFLSFFNIARNTKLVCFLSKAKERTCAGPRERQYKDKLFFFFLLTEGEFPCIHYF